MFKIVRGVGVGKDFPGIRRAEADADDGEIDAGGGDLFPVNASLPFGYVYSQREIFALWRLRGAFKAHRGAGAVVGKAALLSKRIAGGIDPVRRFFLRGRRLGQIFPRPCRQRFTDGGLACRSVRCGGLVPVVFPYPSG